MHVQSVQSYCFCSLNMQHLWRFRCSHVVDLKLPIVISSQSGRGGLTRRGRLQEVPNIVIIYLETFRISEKWSLIRGGLQREVRLYLNCRIEYLTCRELKVWMACLNFATRKMSHTQGLYNTGTGRLPLWPYVKSVIIFHIRNHESLINQIISLQIKAMIKWEKRSEASFLVI